MDYVVLLKINLPQFFVAVSDLLLPTAFLGGLALILGLIMAVVAKLFSIAKDEKQEKILEALPGANCGACGFPGCDGYAAYLANGGEDTAKCTVGGPSLSPVIAELAGVEASESIPVVAHVYCKGGNSHTGNRFVYEGTATCFSAAKLFSGPGSCTYGCMGYGDCVKVCPYDAIDIIDGIAVINEYRCKACKKCVQACPKNIISMVPSGIGDYKVECSNHWTGGEIRKHCKVGCIACQRCVKACEFDAITMDNNLAVIDPLKCTGCSKCYGVCPTKTISSPSEILMHV